MKGGDNMPNRDHSGPEGKGPKTGRGLGECNDSKTTQTNKPLGRRRAGLRTKRRSI